MEENIEGFRPWRINCRGNCPHRQILRKDYFLFSSPEAYAAKDFGPREERNKRTSSLLGDNFQAAVRKNPNGFPQSLRGERDVKLETQRELRFLGTLLTQMGTTQKVPENLQRIPLVFG